jgi:hypothetical protein
MTSQLIREPARDGLREAAETVIAEAAIDGSGAASVPKDAMRKLAIAVNKAALAQPAPAQTDALREALKQAAEWFDQYGVGHLEKGATDKAMRNYARRDYCLDALAQPAPEPEELDRAADEILRRAYRPTPEPASEPALTFRDRAAQGKAYLLKLSDGGQPEQFRTVAGLRRQEPEASDLFVGVGGLTGSQAELQIKAIALRGTRERVELYFEDGERVRGSALFREVHFLGDGNGEATYCISLHLTEVEHV